MNILAFDTALQACSAAVLSAEGGRRQLAHVYEARTRGHAEALLPMIETVMAEAGFTYRDLDRIAVTTGPGTFTGVRIAVAAARGLALATSLPVVGETTLAVMAHMARARLGGGRRPLAIAVDARRGQLYVALFDTGGAALTAPALLSPEAAAAHLPEGVIAAGSGARLLAEAAARRSQMLEAALPDLQPDAAALAEMALTRPPPTEPVKPLYLRPPDAKPQATRLPRA